MPELPEVETIRKQLADTIIGSKITNVWFDNPKSLQPNPEIFLEGVKGMVIQKIGRKAKLLVFYLNNGKAFVVHLKLTGRLLIRQPEDPKDPFVHVVLILGARSKELGAEKEKSRRLRLLELRFADARKFGVMRLLKDKRELEKLLFEYGPEPFKDLTLEKFKGILAKNKRSIKEVLMDQKIISGLGNIYANDALWLAKIHPQVPANQIKDTTALFRAIQEVLTEGLKTGGASDQWYLNAFGEKGKYQEHFKVYGRVGKPCLQCKTLIKRIVIASRGTFYCPKCQKS